MSSLCQGFPLKFQGLSESLIIRFVKFISDPITFSLFHRSLDPLIQKHYVLLLPKLIAHLKLPQLLIPTVVAQALDSSPSTLFIEDDFSSQILVQWILQQMGSDFIPSLTNLLQSLQSHGGVNSKCTRTSKILQFLNDYPQPLQFWSFLSYFCEMIALKHPGYELIALGKFFFLRYLCPLIRLSGDNRTDFYIMLANELSTLVLSLHAPSIMLPPHYNRDLMVIFLSKLASRSAVNKLPDIPRPMTLTPSDCVQFFALVPQLSPDFNQLLREGKHHHLEEKWVTLVLEWTTRIDTVSGISFPNKCSIISTPTPERKRKLSQPAPMECEPIEIPDLVQSTSMELDS